MNQVFAAAVSEMDTSIGVVSEALQAAGAWDNTITIFFSDNGGKKGFSSNHPFRGAKNSFFEGGIHCEAFVYTPGARLPLSRRGTSWDGIVHAVDWYATIVEGMAEVPLPLTTGPITLDSLNVWPALLTGTASPRSQVVHQAVPPEVETEYPDLSLPQAIRVGRFKLIVGRPGFNTITGPLEAAPTNPVPFGQSGGRIEEGTDHCEATERPVTRLPNMLCQPACLFDIVNDPGETNDLANEEQHAAEVERLLNLLRAAADQAGPLSLGIFQGSMREATQERNAVCAATGFALPNDYSTVPPPPPVSTVRWMFHRPHGCCATEDGSETVLTSLAFLTGLSVRSCKSECARDVNCTGFNIHATQIDDSRWSRGDCELLGGMSPIVRSDSAVDCRCFTKRM